MTHDGQLFLWGDNAKQQLGSAVDVGSDQSAMCALVRVALSSANGTKVDSRRCTLVACGWSHTVAVVGTNQADATARVLTWGVNEHHQLGRPDSTSTPTCEPHDAEIPRSLRCAPVLSVSCGWKHSLLSLSDGSVFAWGSGRHGELGLGPSKLSAREPTILDSLPTSGPFRVLCGWQHSVLYDCSTGAVITCGNNRHGQLGVSPTAEKARFLALPVMMSSDSDDPLTARQVDTGWHFVLCVQRDGTLVAWGKGSHGQLGLGGVDGAHTPTKLPFTETVKSIACGSEHALVLTDRNQVYSCGWGEHGNLGHGDQENRLELTRVEYFATHGLRVESVAAGGAVSIAVVSP
ncbi:hypothetical protein PINS_up004067 [Pythium insidiosum]|nr:hypothetical protein PINS_up004067 [Pythium insidiosum]